LKERKNDHSLSALFERAKEQSLFLKEQKCDCSFGRSFEKSEKRAIAHSLFCKERQKERLLICLFKRANEQVIALLKRAEMSNERLPNPDLLECINACPTGHSVHCVQ